MATRPSGGRISLSRLRLIAIVGPVAFLAIVLILLRSGAGAKLHHGFPGFLYLLVNLALIVSTFSLLVFRTIARLEERVLQQNRHLSVLNGLATMAAENVELEELLDVALDKALEVTSAEVGLIWLREEETGALNVACRRGLGDEPPKLLEPIAEGAIGTGRPFVCERLSEQPLPAAIARRDEFHSAMSVPLKAERVIYGVLGVITRHEHSFTAAEIELLTSMAGQLGLAIRNVRLRERVLDRAVLEEREWLGRELHDSLGQMVGYVNTQTLAVKKLLASGCAKEAERHLAEMEEVSQRVGNDVREAILGLRTSGRGLLPSLRRYLADYRRIIDVHVRLEAAADVEALGLRESTELQLLRIVQESLSNVRKHADAAGATVRLTVEGEELKVEVSDDGLGFDADDLAGTGAPRFGLETMRERAEAIGGTFAVVSSPGSGTTVTACVPIGQPAELAHARLAG